MTTPRSAAIILAAVALLGAGCGDPAGPASGTMPGGSVPASGNAAASPREAPASPAPLATNPGAAATSTATPTPTPAPTTVPSPGADTPTPDSFWSLVERGLRAAGRVEVEISGPNAGTLRFEPDASATAIEGVVGFVCLGGRAYDGQSGFTRIPGQWTCGAPALVAGFRGIGQPIDAWNSSIPTDARRRESITLDGSTWTWRYRATSPFYGGDVQVTVTLDGAKRRITAARRVDPTGVTRYSFVYGAAFPPIAVPR